VAKELGIKIGSSDPRVGKFGSYAHSAMLLGLGFRAKRDRACLKLLKY
jgi:hypothetical protein